METQRLRSILSPSRIEKLLEALVTRAYVLPTDSFQIRDPGALPLRLKAVVEQATQDGRIWACWATSQEMWLFTCEMSLPLSRERGSPVLLVNRYGEQGELTDSGSWIANANGQWGRCSE